MHPASTEEVFISPGHAVLWRAFGDCVHAELLLQRSFDQGCARWADDTNEAHAERVALHARLDAAEREVFVLLAIGKVRATGRVPTRDRSGELLNHPRASPVQIPATVFQNRELAFGPAGELWERQGLMERLFDAGRMQSAELSPEGALYYDVQIAIDELRAVWKADLRADQVVAGYSLPTVSFDALREWWEPRVARYKADGEIPNRKQDENEANTAFPEHKVPRPYLRTLRNDAALTPERWRKPGRRSIA